MSVVPIANGQASRTGRRCGWTSAFPLLLAAALVAAAAAAPAMARPAEQSAPLEQLASTIGGLKASLSAIRQELADMHGANAAGEVATLPPAQVCTPAEPRAALVQELEELRASAAAERAARQHAEAAMTGELTGLRERLAAADAAVAELHQDREALVRRIIELDAQIQEARSSEVVEALVEAEPAALEPVEAHLLPAAGLMRVTQPALAAEALPALKGPGGVQLTQAASRLDLRAELALAQLRIAELSTSLDQARSREEAMQAEVASLRSLTDAEIRRIMGAR